MIVVEILFTSVVCNWITDLKTGETFKTHVFCAFETTLKSTRDSFWYGGQLICGKSNPWVLKHSRLLGKVFGPQLQVVGSMIPVRPCFATLFICTCGCFCFVYHLAVMWWVFWLKLIYLKWINWVGFQYFPPSKFIWYVYCIFVAIGLGGIKFSNYFLHHIYDTKECITETVEDKDADDLKRYYL